MPVPDYQTLMRPALALHERGDLSQRNLRDLLAAEFEVTPEEREERLPSGTARRFANRVGWATTYLVRAGLLERPSRGVTRLTTRGRAALAKNPERIDNDVLDQYPEFREFRGARRRSREGAKHQGTPSPPVSDETTPEEAIEDAYRELRNELAEELLGRVLLRDDRFFEEVVLDVLVALGYGGSKREAAIRVGRAGDGGIDGVIQEDRLGLDVIYVQAKRWARDRRVGPREIREFMGALQDHEAHKGVFITTSDFSNESRELAKRRRIVLIDGKRLAHLMIDTGIGVSKIRSFEISRVDEDYFAEDGDSGGS